MYLADVVPSSGPAFGNAGNVLVALYFARFVDTAVMSGMPQACPGCALPSSNADIDPATAKSLAQACSIAARFPPESVLLSRRSGTTCRPQMPPVELM